jgi:hypothetical protein
VFGGLIYQNGAPDYLDAREMTEFVQANDFTLPTTLRLNWVTIWAAFGGTNVDPIDPVIAMILADNGGQPGDVLFTSSGIASRSPENLQFGGLPVYRYDVQLGVSLLPGTYWIALHNGPLTNNAAADFFWISTAANGTAPGYQSALPVPLVFSEAGGELSFQLDGDSLAIPEPATWSALAGLAACFAWRGWRKSIPLLVLSSAAVWAQNAITLGTPTPERPTFTSLGVRVPVSGDVNRNAVATLQYRGAGTLAWQSALPLHRVWAETAEGVEEFAGSVMDLRPDSSYELQIAVSDPDGGGRTFLLTGRTRGLVTDPVRPRQVFVNNVLQLPSALAQARPGDVINIMPGTYFLTEMTIGVSGTPENPIVVRGSGIDQTILDGAGCSSCNMLNLSGSSYVTIENLTVQNVERAFKFVGTGMTRVTIQRTRLRNVLFGAWGQGYHTDFLFADNLLEGRVPWPAIYPNDAGASGGSFGYTILGAGHVIAHNRFSQFPNAILFEYRGSRACDVYGNEIVDNYDNAVETDWSSGNIRVYRNRFTNSFAPLSVQPIQGGPAYLFRNVGINVVDEAIKFHAAYAPSYGRSSGVYAFHNSFVGQTPLSVQTGDPASNFLFQNNLFVGKRSAAQTVIWSAPIIGGSFNYNGYFPDGEYIFNQGRYYNLMGLAQVRSTLGWELQGLVLEPDVFASGIVGPEDYRPALPPSFLTLRSGASAQDRALLLPNINDRFRGAGPDLGALELGCSLPVYGPRAAGLNESTEPRYCEDSTGWPTVRFERADYTTRGVWNTTYAGGYSIAGDSTSLPAGVTVSQNGVPVVYQNPSSSIRALRRGGSTSRVAAAWSAPSVLNVSVGITGAPRRVAVYFLDWSPTATRSVRVEVVDGSGRVWDTRTLSDFTGGQYLVWQLSGQLTLRVTSLNGSDAVVSGVFVN